MQTRQEAIQYCHSFQDVYEDYPFHDDNWCVMRHFSSGLNSPTEMSLRRMAEQHRRRQLRCCAARLRILFEIRDFRKIRRPLLLFMIKTGMYG